VPGVWNVPSGVGSAPPASATPICCAVGWAIPREMSSCRAA